MKDTNILVFGESIAYGAYDKDKCGWVNRVRIEIEEKCFCNVFNLGIAGEDTKGILERFESECKGRFDEQYENIIIFQIGINDSLNENGKDYMEFEVFTDNIYKLIELAKKYTNNIIFLGMTKVDEQKVNPVPWNKKYSYHNVKIEKFDNKLKDICNEENVRYIEMYNRILVDDMNDGLHPNETGHKIIADIVLEEIEKIPPSC